MAFPSPRRAARDCNQKYGVTADVIIHKKFPAHSTVANEALRRSSPET
jgi:hypothetical protein